LNYFLLHFDVRKVGYKKMNRQFLFISRLLITIFLVLTLNFNSALKAQNNSKAIKITDRDGQQVILYQESHALLIWMSQYKSWPQLDAVEKGARLLKDALIKDGFDVITKGNLTSNEFYSTINNFVGKYGYNRDNRLVIFFAGHGYTIDGTDGYLVATDTPNPIIDEPGFYQFAISMEDVMGWARKIKAKHTFFVFDSCFSGTLFTTKSRQKLDDSYIRTVTAEPVRQFLTAGSAEEEVPAGNDFVELLVGAIEGDADTNYDGYVTGAEIGNFVEQTLPRLTNNAQTPQYGTINNYSLSRGDTVFRSLRKPKNNPVGSNPPTIPNLNPSEETKSPTPPIEIEPIKPTIPDLRTDLQALQRISQVSIEYFIKNGDRNDLQDIIKQLGFRQVTIKKPINSSSTNTIWFGTPVNIEDIKYLATTLVESGVKIRMIRPFLTDSPRRNKYLIQIGAAAGYYTSQGNLYVDEKDNYYDDVDCPVWTIDKIQSAYEFTKEKNGCLVLN